MLTITFDLVHKVPGSLTFFLILVSADRKNNVVLRIEDIDGPPLTEGYRQIAKKAEKRKLDHLEKENQDLRIQNEILKELLKKTNQAWLKD